MENLRKTYFIDEINEETIFFFTNASESTIEALSFAGEWYHVKKGLILFGYTVIEEPVINLN